MGRVRGGALGARLTVLFAALMATGGLEGWEGIRQKRRGADRTQDRDPNSYRLLMLTCWPAGLLALAGAIFLPRLTLARRQQWAVFGAGLMLMGLGVGLRQWAIRTLGHFFVGYVSVQPDHRVVQSGPYRWVRHPSYTGLWLQFVGLGLATGNSCSLISGLLLPLVGIVRRIAAEETALAAALPADYPGYARRTKRLIPFLW
jgi:protein-S-isoprenylcysteine O-methyltransferase